MLIGLVRAQHRASPHGRRAKLQGRKILSSWGGGVYALGACNIWKGKVLPSVEHLVPISFQYCKVAPAPWNATPMLSENAGMLQSARQGPAFPVPLGKMLAFSTSVPLQL